MIAMPLAAPVSVSDMPPTNVDTSTPTLPLGAAASSSWVMANTGVGSSTGASLAPVTVMVSVVSLVSPSASVSR